MILQRTLMNTRWEMVRVNYGVWMLSSHALVGAPPSQYCPMFINPESNNQILFKKFFLTFLSPPPDLLQPSAGNWTQTLINAKQVLFHWPTTSAPKSYYRTSSSAPSSLPREGAGKSQPTISLITGLLSLRLSGEPKLSHTNNIKSGVIKGPYSLE
jgi:hypothetical protein